MKMLGDDIRLSERLAMLVGEHPELELLTQSLSITTFRYVPPELRARTGEAAVEASIRTLNEALLERIQQSGELFVSNAVIRGRYALRACIVNFNTSIADIEAVPGIVVRMGREIHASHRSTMADPV
jgi:glutamate/tyrosine decarboxylase-like PLP-dependent enzyme